MPAEVSRSVAVPSMAGVGIPGTSDAVAAAGVLPCAACPRRGPGGATVQGHGPADAAAGAVTAGAPHRPRRVARWPQVWVTDDAEWSIFAPWDAASSRADAARTEAGAALQAGEVACAWREGGACIYAGTAVGGMGAGIVGPDAEEAGAPRRHDALPAAAGTGANAATRTVPRPLYGAAYAAAHGAAGHGVHGAADEVAHGAADNVTRGMHAAADGTPVTARQPAADARRVPAIAPATHARPAGDGVAGDADGDATGDATTPIVAERAAPAGSRWRRGDRRDARRAAQAGTGQPPPRAAQPPRRRRTNPRYYVYLLVAGSLLFAHETHYSRLQAYVLARVAGGVSFTVQPGAALYPAVPDTGTFDERLGYAQLHDYIERSRRAGYAITRQAQPSVRARLLKSAGLFQVYDEKRQAGLDIRDRNGELIYSARHPDRVYERFDAVPPLLAASLLHVEDRELLHPATPLRNPVVDWERLIKAILFRAIEDDRVIGASTLATQIEKVRHSPDGRTTGAEEKLRQMATASVRVYRAGEDTRAARRQLVADYLDNLPLAARPGHGEVWGLGDGLELWYGADFAAANAALRSGDVAAAALPYKQALSLVLSARRPSHYLVTHPEELGSFTDSYLRVLAAGGVITPALRDAALAAPLEFVARPTREPIVYTDRKGANLVRARLQTMFGLPSLYPLDRLDLAVGTTLHQRSNAEATQLLASLASDDEVRRLELDGFRLLDRGKPEKVIYSMSLFERTGDYNVLRVNVDNFDQPFDINTGSRLDLGSTAKLRTLATWLELIAETHAQWSQLDAPSLVALDVHERDDLGQWLRGVLLDGSGAGLEQALRLAIERPFSASPAASFFTGGGRHRFVNFDPADNGRTMSVREALAQSVNLVFIRVMREVVNHLQYRDPDSAARALLDGGDTPLRDSYLRQFADREGQKFIRDFHRKYAGRDADAQLTRLLDSHALTPVRLATIVRSVAPELDVEAMGALFRRHLPDSKVPAAELADLFARYAIDRYSLADRGYLARVHPLELWLLGYLRAHPGASMSDVIAASEGERQEVYRWLFRTSRRQAQDARIQVLLELEAFLDIQRRWQRLGYPFESLTPSLATAIGSSADRPAALGELLGIIVNGGLRLPTVLVDGLAFGTDTIYETTLQRLPASGERVMAPEVARVLHEAMRGVVETGTARALGSALKQAGMEGHVIAGKTGTGDHRHEVYGAGGRTIESRVVNRTAIFAFTIDDRFFGTIIAFVPGQAAAQYGFTSGLPVRVLGALLPRIRALIECPPPGSAGAPPAVDTAAPAGAAATSEAAGTAVTCDAPPGAG
jgi:membrane peptidoglycan carboxypeptidase